MKTLSSLFSKILVVALVLTIALSQVSLAAAQSGTSTNITSYDQISEMGQLVIPAGIGFKAPASMHGLVATIWYGGKDDTTNSFVNFSNGIAKDRVAKYGGSSSDYPTMIWAGASDTITGTQNCRDGFYSDSVIIAKGVVYGDRCPMMIEYHLENFVSVVPAPAAETPANPETYNPPAGGNFSLPNWVVWIFSGTGLLVICGILFSLFLALLGLGLWIWSVVVMWRIHWIWGLAALVTGVFFPVIAPIIWLLLHAGVATWWTPAR